MHGLVRQHGLADDVADGEDVGHVGAHLDVDVDEAAVGHGHTSFVGGDLIAVGLHPAACSHSGLLDVRRTWLRNQSDTKGIADPVNCVKPRL